MIILKRLLQAIQFLTRFPIPNRFQKQNELGRAGLWFPFVGLLIGFILVLGNYVFNLIFPSIISAIVVVTIWEFLTGFLHLDGLADCCDAFLASVSKERRFEILHDPHLGTFGTASVFLYLLLKVAALVYLPSQYWIALLLAPVLGRWSILITATQPTANEGLGKSFSRDIDWSIILLGTIIPFALLIIGGRLAIIAGLFAYISIILILWISRRSIGGITGDVMGLVVETTELVTLLVFII